jgi:AraC-like DNA-binding protein
LVQAFRERYVLHVIGDVVAFSPALRARLARAGGNVAHAAAVARIAQADTVTTDQYFTFWQALAESSPPDIGLRLATETQVHEYEVAQLAAFHSPDAQTALEKMARYKRLCGPKDMSIERAGEEVVVHTRWVHASTPSPPRLIDASFASLLTLLQRATGKSLAPKRLELSRARGDEVMLMRFFGCPLRFRATRDALVLESHVLAMPFVTHNADLLDVLVPGLEQKVAPLSATFLEAVESAVARRMIGERPSVEKVAEALALSSRTLQRRLGEIGVSYQQVLDGVRHQTALRLLRARRIDISEIAFLLGFEELNSFTRAFRAWEGVTPKRWRDSMS